MWNNYPYLAHSGRMWRRRTVKKKKLYIRLSGKESANWSCFEENLKNFKIIVIGSQATSFWNSIRDQNLKFFTDKISGNTILWRISVPLARISI